jgi:hypothetical protein
MPDNAGPGEIPRRILTFCLECIETFQWGIEKVTSHIGEILISSRTICSYALVRLDRRLGIIQFLSRISAVVPVLSLGSWCHFFMFDLAISHYPMFYAGVPFVTMFTSLSEKKKQWVIYWNPFKGLADRIPIFSGKAATRPLLARPGDIWRNLRFHPLPGRISFFKKMKKRKTLSSVL